MSCEKWQEMIIDRIADELSESDAIIVEQHLADCAACREEFDHLKGLFSTAGRRENWQPDREMESRLLAQMPHRFAPPAKKATDTTSETTRRFSLSATILRMLFLRPVPSYALVTALICAIVCGFWWGQSMTPVTSGAGPTEHQVSSAAIFDSSFIANAADLSSHGSAVARDSIATVRAGLQRPLRLDLAFVAAQTDAIRGR